jgi:hypothetical protein
MTLAARPHQLMLGLHDLNPRRSRYADQSTGLREHGRTRIPLSAFRSQWPANYNATFSLIGGSIDTRTKLAEENKVTTGIDRKTSRTIQSSPDTLGASASGTVAQRGFRNPSRSEHAAIQYPRMNPHPTIVTTLRSADNAFGQRMAD